MNSEQLSVPDRFFNQFVAYTSIYIQWNLHNPTFNGKRKKCRISKLSDYRITSIIRRVAVGKKFPFPFPRDFPWEFPWEFPWVSHVGIPMSFPMWEFPRGKIISHSHPIPIPMGIPMGFPTWEFPYGKTHGNSHMGIPTWKTHFPFPFHPHSHGKTHSHGNLDNPTFVENQQNVGLRRFHCIYVMGNMINWSFCIMSRQYV